MDVAIVGAGLGGLALGIRLQAAGHRTTVFEARSQPGGRAGQIVDRGYVFDTGPSVVTLPSLIREVFAVAGRRLEDELDVRPLDPFYRLYFADGAHFDYSGTPEAMRAEMARFSPRDAARYDAFFAHTGRIYQQAVVELGDQPFLRLTDFLRIVPPMLSLRALRPVTSTVWRAFEEPHLRRVFSFQPLFIGGNPFTTPSIYAMFPFLERSEGVHFIMGGMFRLVEAFCRLYQALGGDLRLGSPVERIVVAGGAVSGVVANGRFLPAPAVVSNADVGQTLDHLLPTAAGSGWPLERLLPPGLAGLGSVRRLLAHRRRWSMSCVLLFLGTNRVYPKLRHHTIVFGDRYRDLIADIVDRRVVPDDFSMYVHAPARTDPSMAPPGGDSIYVLVPVANLGGTADWATLAPRFRERLLDFLERDFGLEGLRQSIVVERLLTPDAYFRDELRSTLGNAFQLQPLLTQSAYFRPHCRHPAVKGMYLVGAGTHPGPGVPGVLLSARMVARVIGGA